MAIRISIIDRAFNSLFTGAQNGQPAKLTIRLKVVLLPRDPLGPDGSSYLAASPDVARRHRGLVQDANHRKSFRCRGWNVKAWNDFRARFKWVAELVWN